ncbi:MAG: hypothetical protein [Bacteriophage sp.]|nr:MAG: hypothetical protein [Bacteriophage sp.]
MDNFDYDSMGNIATELIAKFGVAYYLKRAAVTNTVDGVQVVTRPPAVKIMGVKVEYNQKEIDGTLIKAGDLKMVCDARVKDIAIGDKVVISGQSWRVENPNPVIPADTLICYKLQLRMEV